MQLVDAYIEQLEWEYRHREAAYWARRNLEMARESQDFNFVGRAVRITVEQLITDRRRVDEGLQFLTQAVEWTRGSASEAIVAREFADRLAQAGKVAPLSGALRLAIDRSGPVDERMLRASVANAVGKHVAALNLLTETSHPDPYMKNHVVQLEAEARHAIGDYRQSVRVLENGIRLLDRPGTRHFSKGLQVRLASIAGKPYSPELWKWRRAWNSKPAGLG